MELDCIPEVTPRRGGGKQDFQARGETISERICRWCRKTARESLVLFMLSRDVFNLSDLDSLNRRI